MLQHTTLRMLSNADIRHVTELNCQSHDLAECWCTFAADIITQFFRILTPCVAMVIGLYAYYSLVRHRTVSQWRPSSVECWWTSLPSQFTSVSTTRRRSTWQTAVSLTQISLVVSDCAQHIVASWTYRAIDELHSAVERSLSLNQPSGIRFQSSSEMRLRTLSGIIKNTAFHTILVCSAH